MYSRMGTKVVLGLTLLVAGASAFGMAPALAPSSVRVRSASTCTVMQQQGVESDSRRSFLRLAAAAVPAVFGMASPSLAATESPVPEIAIGVLKTIAGGSQAELDAFAATPKTPLSGIDASIYKVYKYAASKCPATEDMRASLRGLFTSQVADGVLKWAKTIGVEPKEYDARGDGLTNGGKGGAVKGASVLLEGFQKKGLIKSFTVDASKHDENTWLQAQPTTMTVTITGGAGSAAAAAFKDEEKGMMISLAASGMQGYFKKVKLFSSFEQSFDGDVETLKITLKWAGKDRQGKTLSRRANDKLNAARAYTKEEKEEKEEK